MTKVKNIFTKGFAFALAILFVFMVASCKKCGDDGDEPTPTPTPTPEEVVVSLTATQDTIKKGETVNLSVSITGSTNTTYTWTISDPTLVSIENNQLTVIADTTIDKMVTVTATSNADTNAKASKTFKVLAPVIEGQVGELTHNMLQNLGNASITVTGVLTDIYQDFNMSINSSTQKYDMVVKMEKDKWSGSWNIQSDKQNVITDNYRKGEEDGLKDQYGNIGHALERLYIDKDNKVAVKRVTDYISVPAIWEAQHLWNHLNNLQINKFTYDAETEVYKYNADFTNEDDAYLMTYLAYSLTPLLEDTLAELYLVVEDGKITKMLAQTEILYYGENQEEDPDAMSYTTIELVFSEIGTTKVEDPQPYDAPEYVEKLQAALDKMKNANNYTFHTKDVQTYAPSTDGNDYEIQSVSTAISTSVQPLTSSVLLSAVKNHTSSVGTVGCYGQITKDAVLFATTGKYSYTMDGNDYYTNYTGYKQNNNNTYDYFEYNGTQNALVGKKWVSGSFFDALPSFDFSANVFECVGQTISNGKTRYTYQLRESSITRDIAMQVCAYSYADDADPSSTSSFTIVVDDDGNLISTTFPYSLVSGTYMGYCTTTYSNVGTTELEEGLFDNYVPREVKTSWSEYITKYYSPTNSTLDSREENAAVVFEAIFGDAAKDIPSPSLFMNIIGDNINGPFYDWKEKGTDSDGNPIKTGFVNINVTSSEYDENSRITNFDELMAQFKTALEAEGFTLSVANTDTSGGESGRGDRYVCFTKGDIQIVFQNNHTKYIWIYFYKTGDWTLNR